MNDTYWWEDHTTEIASVETTDNYVRTLQARETPEGWEYAIVLWRYRVPTLETRFLNGKIIHRQHD